MHSALKFFKNSGIWGKFALIFWPCNQFYFFDGIDLPWISVVKTEKELLHLEVDLMEHFLDGIAPLGHW